MIYTKKNAAFTIPFPMVDSSTPASLKSGLSITVVAYYKDGAGAWTTLSPAASAAEIGITGIYSLAIAQAEANHDLLAFKFTASGAADQSYLFTTQAVSVEDLVRSTTPANTLDVSATGEAGLDFSNIKDATGAHTLTNITIPVVTDVAGKVLGGGASTITAAGVWALSGGGSALATSASVGTPTALDGGAATLAGMLLKIAGGTTGGFVETSDGLHYVSTKVATGVPASLTASSAPTLTTGTLISGAYTDTYLSDGTYLIYAPVTPAVGGYGLNLYIPFLTTAGQIVNTVTIRGFFSAAGARYCNVFAYNWATSTWDQLSDSTNRMNGTGATNATFTFTLLPAHQKSDGTVQIGFKSPSTTTGDRLEIDQILVNVAVAGPTAGQNADAVYARLRATFYNDGVYVNTINGFAGTDPGVNGIPTHPVSNLADAYTIAAALGVKKLYLAPDSSITLTQSADYWSFEGQGLIALNGQSINDAHFEGLESITGVSTGDDARFVDCFIGAVSVNACVFHDCRLLDNVTLLSSGSYIFRDCSSGLPGATPPPIINFVANAKVALRNHSGGIQTGGFASTNQITYEGNGRFVIGSDTSGGVIWIRGNVELYDNVSGGFTGTLVDSARYNEDQNITNATGKILGGGSATITGTGVNIGQSSADLVWSSAARTLTGEGFKKNTALNNFSFPMRDTVDHVSIKTGLTVTAQRSIDGGAFAACANAVSEIGSTGVYKINLAAADLNGDVIVLLFSATGGDTLALTIKTNA